MQKWRKNETSIYKKSPDNPKTNYHDMYHNMHCRIIRLCAHA